MPAKYVIVGGGLAGAKAADQLRRSDPEGAITLICAESVLPYDRPPLSKEFLRGEWQAEKLLLYPPTFYQEKGIDVVLGRPAVDLDLPGQRVLLDDGAEIGFTQALLATGARPRRLDIPGADLPGVRYFRDRQDAEALGQDGGAAGKRVVVIGAGFIGIEVAASLAQMGAQVTVLEVMPYIWSRFVDEELAGYFQGYCEARGITFRTSVQPAAIEGNGRAQAVTLATGEVLPCDAVCIGVGIELNTALAAAAGLQIDNGVVVNQHMETSHPGVYAAGDLINYYDPIFEKRRRVEHWGHAEYTGLIAAQNMAGEQQTYDLLSYVWSDIFDLRLEFGGEEKDFDELLVRGNRADNSFAVLYLKEHVLRAYLAVNVSAREFLPLQRMIRQRTDLSQKKDALRDPAAALRGLL